VATPSGRHTVPVPRPRGPRRRRTLSTPGLAHAGQFTVVMCTALHCRSGRGEDAYTSGFEFPWTTKPYRSNAMQQASHSRWDNEYFNNVLNYNWTKGMGPGDRTEWKVRRGGKLKYKQPRCLLRQLRPSPRQLGTPASSPSAC
jgi:catalase (peroxidase I)